MSLYAMSCKSSSHWFDKLKDMIAISLEIKGLAQLDEWVGALELQKRRRQMFDSFFEVTNDIENTQEVVDAIHLIQSIDKDVLGLLIDRKKNLIDDASATVNNINGISKYMIVYQ